MFSTELIRDLHRHMEWADASVWRTCGSVSQGPPDAGLRSGLLHIHYVQRAFLQLWTGQPIPPATPEDFAELSALREWARPCYAEARHFLDTLEPARLTGPITMPWLAQFENRLGRRLETPTLADTAFQVTSHSTYHRGQVNRRLRELGVEPPLVDYIAWVWFGRPAAEWPT